MTENPPASRSIVRKHHLLVRIAHWANVPILFAMIASGLAIYWASPVVTHRPDPVTQSTDYLDDLGFFLARHLPGQSGYAKPWRWAYDHFSLGPQNLAEALRWHWFFAYLFLANGLLYLAGLAIGGGWRALLPRRGDLAGGAAMVRYYAGLLPARLLRRRWPHPKVPGKYNPLQRAGYLAMPLFGALAVATGWAIHKPVALPWLAWLLGGYDRARLWHFLILWVFLAFLVPHVVLAVADGWDTLRSMVTGWSARPLPPASAEVPVEVPERALRRQSRRAFLALAAGAAAGAAGLWWLSPEEPKAAWVSDAERERLDSLAARLGATRRRREKLLDRGLTFDDDVAEALYSPGRRVRTYARSEVTPLRNNYEGETPGPGYLPTWRLEVSGLASGRAESLSIEDLLRQFPRHEQVTRLVCVEGWSAIAWWGGLRLADFLAAYPPAAGARWASLESSVNLDEDGRSDPYYVSLDLATARHPQTLLATHLAGSPLTVAHGAPLRLVAPMKLGLKNIKAITRIAYSEKEPRDYWSERGYSKYDGI